MQNICSNTNKTLVIYLSMGFGNPYGEEWSAEIVQHWSEVLHKELGISILALSDTIGCATPTSVSALFSELILALPDVEFGAHLHTRSENAIPILKAAYEAGCCRFDGALYGFGGCPMAKDDLTGNMPTEIMYDWFKINGVDTGIVSEEFKESYIMANTIFPKN
jgi:hydroxymethylglutaryl-CoA lyase